MGIDQDSLTSNNINKKLIFVYNAKSGFINGIVDYIHKIISPETCFCNLCKLTYNNTGKVKIWADYLENLPVEVLFLYKDNIEDIQLSLVYTDEALPYVLLQILNQKIYLITSDELNKIKILEE